MPVHLIIAAIGAAAIGIGTGVATIITAIKGRSANESDKDLLE